MLKRVALISTERGSAAPAIRRPATLRALPRESLLRLIFSNAFCFQGLARGGPKQVEVTVTPSGGRPVSGALVRIDTFNVSLREASGEYQTIRRGPNVKVEVRDPLAMHHELLDQYTDADMHNILAYLETLK
jgi:hypothetical protein